MDGLWACDSDDADHDDTPSSTRYDVILKFNVPDPALLWQAAARRLEGSGLEPGDVDETIGSIDDPSIDDCLATLMLPMVADGCELVDVHVLPSDRAGEAHGSNEGLRLN
jgi:hypothetical protein